MECNLVGEAIKRNSVNIKEDINEMLRKSIESVDKRSFNIRQDLNLMRDEFMKNLNKKILNGMEIFVKDGDRDYRKYSVKANNSKLSVAKVELTERKFTDKIADDKEKCKGNRKESSNRLDDLISVNIVTINSNSNSKERYKRYNSNSKQIHTENTKIIANRDQNILFKQAFTKPTFDNMNTSKQTPKSIYNSPFSNLNGLFPPPCNKDKTAKDFTDTIHNKNSRDSFTLKLIQNKNLFLKPLPKINVKQKKSGTRIKILNLGADSTRQQKLNLGLYEESKMLSTSSKTLSVSNKSTIKSSQTSKNYLQNEERKAQNFQALCLNNSQTKNNFDLSVSATSDLNNSIRIENEISAKEERMSNFRPTQKPIDTKETHMVQVNKNLNVNVIDDRKFSILDVQACESAVALNSKFPEEISNNISLNSSQLSDYSSITNKASKDFIKNLEKERKLTKSTKFIYILAKSDVLPIKLRSQVRRLDKLVLQEYPYVELMNDYSEIIRKKIKKFKKEINSFISLHNIRNSSLLSSRFQLTKTAQNCLNFLTKQEEADLLHKFREENRSELLVDIIRIIYILLDKDPNTFLVERLMENIMDNILAEYKVLNLKSLLFKLISDYRQGKAIVKEQQIRLLNSVIENNKNVLDYGLALKHSKAASYMTFFLIEIYNYFNLKTEDGALVFDVRNKYIDIEKLEKELLILQYPMHNK